jgi:hypothetical protein
LSSSQFLAERMRQQEHPSHFRLGESLSGDGGVCDPHVSLFMLPLEEPEINAAVQAVRSAAAASSAISAEGAEYRHNPQGAPELYFTKSAEWAAIQRAVVAAAEPLRRGRLRQVDPAGARLVDVIDRLRRDEPHGAQLHQLLTYGYDEVVDDQGDRFNPHVTLAWPKDTFRVDLAGLPAAAQFSGVLSQLAVYGMSEYGTCTKLYASFSLESRGVAALG